MLGGMDTFDFLLAERLCQPLHVVRSWPNVDVEQWRALWRARDQQAELHGRR